MTDGLTQWTGRWIHPAFWIANGLGSGLIRPAPGTWGSAFALLTGFFIYHYLGWWALHGAALAASLIGIWAAYVWQRKTGLHDDGRIVIDEVAGQWIVLLPLPLLPAEGDPSWVAYLLAFGLFRLFDILKPGPIGWLDRKVGGGLGVMLDDILAGLAGGAVIYALALYWWPF